MIWLLLMCLFHPWLCLTLHLLLQPYKLLKFLEYMSMPLCLLMLLYCLACPDIFYLSFSLNTRITSMNTSSGSIPTSHPHNLTLKYGYSYLPSFYLCYFRV